MARRRDSNENESIWSRILDRIPGFAGYADLDRRQDSDQQARQWLQGRLSEARSRVDQAIKLSVARADLGEVAQWDAVRQRLDLVANRLRVNLRPGEGILGRHGRLDDEELQDLYDLEADLLDDAAEVVRRIEAATAPLDGSSQPPANAPAEVARQLDILESALDRRRKLMAGEGN